MNEVIKPIFRGAALVQKEEIYDSIDFIKNEGTNSSHKSFFYSNFRNELLCYEHSLSHFKQSKNNSNRYNEEELKCFVDAANKQYEVANNIENLSYKLGMAVMFFIPGLLITYSLVNLCTPNALSKFALASINFGGVFGSFLGYEFADLELEEQGFGVAAHECAAKLVGEVEI